ncbi:MAG: acetate--CoA ligase [Thermotogae bacterium]|nr:acetate--CoA ligase [Thermotogota bacterium]
MATALPFEEYVKVDGWKFVPPEEYLKEHAKTLTPEFWLSEARKIDWYEDPTVALEGDHPFYRWFSNGKLNMSYLTLDRHMENRKHKVALFWLGEDGSERVLTYGQYHRLVNRLAYAFSTKWGIKKGDRVAIYMPMIPELPAVMLALARIGAIFSVVFSGFSANALAERIKDSGARYLITADGSYRRGKRISLQENVRRATQMAPVEGILVFERLKRVWIKTEGDILADEFLKEVPHSVYVEPVAVESHHPLFILYTSGTTGKPKGIIHDTGGYAVLLNSTMDWVFDAKEEDVYWCAADIGWITGHSYIVFGPFMKGLTSVMYEGVPNWPDPGIWWSIVERYGVSIFYTSPTAIRLLMRYGDEYVLKYDLSSLRILHSVGEPINPEAWWWYYKKVGRERCPVGSTWWMTETGGVMISHTPGWKLVPLKPGTNGYPIPGVSVSVLRPDGSEASEGERGYLVINSPWPGMPLSIWGDDERYLKTYWERFPQRFYTGDYAIRDGDSYVWVLGRADEVMNVAGHRLGTYEIESAIVEHEAVSEAAVVGIPDEVKGEVPVAFVVLKVGYEPSEELAKEIKNTVREILSPIAVPKDVVFVSKLPKTRSGKIMRRLLRAVFLGAPLGDVTTLEDEASVEEVKRAYEHLKGELG